MRFYFRLSSNFKALWASSLVWLWLAGLVLAGCSKVGVDNAITPVLPLPSIILLTDTSGTATLNLDSLAGGRAFTITFGTFQHGRIEVASGTLRYTTTDTSRRWPADSSIYSFCQANQCRDGQIKVRNIRYKKDSTLVEPKPDTCALIPLRRFQVEEAATVRISLGFSATDTGTLVVSNVAYTLRQIGSRSSTLFEYIASGGQQNYYSGFDEITFSGTVEGRRVCGTVEVVIGDSCQPRARPDVITRAPSGATTILPATLLSNDLGCMGEQASYSLRLSPRLYTGTLQVSTRLGTITDTTIGSSQALVYRRNAATSAGADVFYYYIQNRSTDLVTRTTVSLP